MKCEIRPWKPEDARSLAAALSNKNVLNNLRDGLPYPYTEADAADYIEAMLAADPRDTFAFAIVADGRAVGSIGAFRQGNIHARTAELGYYVAQEYWGKGIMTDAVRQLCDRIFAETDIIRIYAEPFAYNIGSRRVLEKAGFTCEGILRANAVKNGRVEDMVLYARTKMTESYYVRRLVPEEIPQAKDLIWDVFLKFVAPGYTEEGVREFRASLDDGERTRLLHFYGAFADGQLAGVLAMRAPQHIGYFFVAENFQGRGIGRALFETMRQDYAVQEFTVHASPYAVEIYRRLGFEVTGEEAEVHGLRYTPMKYKA